MISDEETKRRIAANVARLLHERGMCQADLVEKTGESSARVSMMARGLKLPSAAFLARVAEALNTSTDDILSPIYERASA